MWQAWVHSPFKHIETSHGSFFLPFSFLVSNATDNEEAEPDHPRGHINAKVKFKEVKKHIRMIVTQEFPLWALRCTVSSRSMIGPVSKQKTDGLSLLNPVLCGDAQRSTIVELIERARVKALQSVPVRQTDWNSRGVWQRMAILLQRNTLCRGIHVVACVGIVDGRNSICLLTWRQPCLAADRN